MGGWVAGSIEIKANSASQQKWNRGLSELSNEKFPKIVSIFLKISVKSAIPQVNFCFVKFTKLAAPLSLCLRILPPPQLRLNCESQEWRLGYYGLWCSPTMEQIFENIEWARILYREYRATKNQHENILIFQILRPIIHTSLIRNCK